MEKEIIIIPEQLEQQINIEVEPFLLTKTQDKTVSLDMSDGDQVIRPDGDYLMQSVTVEKPETLTPENIVENINIGGVVGSRHIPEEQSKTVELDFSESDTQVITPDDGKLLDSVIINKPETLISENIKKDVEIGGVKGEYETVLPPLDNPANDNDVIQGKEYLDGEGRKHTGDFVPPVDTGENGLYKAILENNYGESVIDSELTYIRGELFRDSSRSSTYYRFEASSMGWGVFNNASAKAVSLPNLIRLSQQSFTSFVGRYVYLPKVTTAEQQVMQGSNIPHIWFPSAVSFTGLSHLRNGKFVSITMGRNFSATSNYMFYQNPNLVALVLLTNSVVSLGTVDTIGSTPIRSGTGYVYVPKAQESSYKSATNWTTYANQIVGIDEDTTATVGTLFTPTTSVTVDHWDMVELQSYSVGTINTTTGAITPTNDGRLLIRGLDANNEILHVTYLQIGTGFDEEANLA